VCLAASLGALAAAPFGAAGATTQGSSGAALQAAVLTSASPPSADTSELATGPTSVVLTMLAGAYGARLTPSAVASGTHDARFVAFDYRTARKAGDSFWVRVQLRGAPLPREQAMPPTRPAAFTVRQGRHLAVWVYPSSPDSTSPNAGVPLAEATERSGFRGRVETFFVLPASTRAGDVLYARVMAAGAGAEELTFGWGDFDAALSEGTQQARMIAGAVAALTAMALSALLIWFVLADRLFIQYASLFSLQALYVAFLSGQGFDWPVLWRALPLGQHAWNVPAALSGAAACLFARDIADLKRFAPRVYAIYGWLSTAFVVVAVANFAHTFGLGSHVSAIGNLLFVGTAVFTLVVSFMAWRRGSRAAGWFLLAWGLLEAFTIGTAVSFLFGRSEMLFLYYGLPISMVIAAMLVALGVADRLREQRVALTDAERRAQTDPLTGVLNRRSLLERLDAAGVRAQARGLPLSLLFIDLDHFKAINDRYGHAAGDACLLAVIKPIQSELRQSDVIGRYGGEEFVVVLSSVDQLGAEAIAERIRERVAALEVTGFGPAIQLTCSIGVASTETLGLWGERLIEGADAAVYAAKNGGRNQVRVALPQAA
jgi:diguanylate cyclase (GGDEF)-like protein